MRVEALIVLCLAVGACTPPPHERPPASEAPARTLAASPPATVVTPFPGVRVTRAGAASTVELDGVVTIEAGWLEQIACGPNTREHESLVVPVAGASQVHAALLMAGFEPGAPGAWSYENDQYRYSAPTGTALSITVRRPAEGEGTREEPIRNWIRDHNGAHEFPDEPWVFAGSRVESHPEGDFYVADYSGSIIGLVTFGDEVVGFSQVLADQDQVRPPEWEANTEVLPPPGTQVTLILRRADDSE